MGYSRWDDTAWSSYRATTATKSTASIFKSRTVPDDLNPKNFTIRESRDSVANPESNAIIIGSDVTGSMGVIAETLIRKGIGIAFEQILERAKETPRVMIPDPHLMVVAIGDVACDRGPVQATQFEADLEIAKQLETVWIEGGGGGNAHESYDVAWYLAANRTAIDCFEKRGKKGYLFTVGDEPAPQVLTKYAIKTFFGDDVESDIRAQQSLEMAQQKYHVFHILLREGFSSYEDGFRRAQATWEPLMHERLIVLDDYTKLAETIVSAIQVNEGMDPHAVAATWSGDTSLVVAKSISGLKPATATSGSGSLFRF